VDHSADIKKQKQEEKKQFHQKCRQIAREYVERLYYEAEQRGDTFEDIAEDVLKKTGQKLR
jgi:hypothetical protein